MRKQKILALVLLGLVIAFVIQTATSPQEANAQGAMERPTIPSYQYGSPGHLYMMPGKKLVSYNRMDDGNSIIVTRNMRPDEVAETYTVDLHPGKGQRGPSATLFEIHEQGPVRPEQAQE